MGSNIEQHVTRWLPAYHDGELPDPQRAHLEAHLATCSACRAELNALQQLSTVLQTASKTTMPGTTADFTQAVVARLLPQPARLNWQQFLQWSWAAAPLLVIAGWAAVQAVLTVAASLLLAGSGLLAETGISAWLLTWISFWLPLPLTSGELLARLTRELPGWFAGLDVVVNLLLLNLALTGACIVLLIGWLAGWWSMRRYQVFSKL